MTSAEVQMLPLLAVVVVELRPPPVGSSGGLAGNLPSRIWSKKCKWISISSFNFEINFPYRVNGHRRRLKDDRLLKVVVIRNSATSERGRVRRGSRSGVKPWTGSHVA